MKQKGKTYTIREALTFGEVEVDRGTLMNNSTHWSKYMRQS
jgi:hypothetical protein